VSGAVTRAQLSSPVWLFVGSNTIAASRLDHHHPPASKKAKGADADAGYVAGRSEHTDHVACSGTWHYQVSGSKVWYLRPLDGADAWRSRRARGDDGGGSGSGSGGGDKHSGGEHNDGCDTPPPELGCRSGGAGGASIVEDGSGDDEEESGGEPKGVTRGTRMGTGKLVRERQKGRRRLRIEVQEGDLLLVDTGAWWHETALPPGALSASYAREFFLHSEHGGEGGARAAAESAADFTNVTGGERQQANATRNL